MGYFVRAFCIRGEIPTLRSVLASAAARGTRLALDPASSRPAALEDSNWTQAGIAYKDNKAPILLEVNRDTGEPASSVREEVEEFLEILEDAPRNRRRTRVAKHLKNTRFILAARLPTADIDEDGYVALGHVLDYFIDHNGAIIQADGEGFYEGRKLVVELE